MLAARCSVLFHYPLSIQDMSMMERADLYIVGRTGGEHFRNYQPSAYLLAHVLEGKLALGACN